MFYIPQVQVRQIDNSNVGGRLFLIRQAIQMSIQKNPALVYEGDQTQYINAWAQFVYENILFPDNESDSEVNLQKLPEYMKDPIKKLCDQLKNINEDVVVMSAKYRDDLTTNLPSTQQVENLPPFKFEKNYRQSLIQEVRQILIQKPNQDSEKIEEAVKNAADKVLETIYQGIMQRYISVMHLDPRFHSIAINYYNKLLSSETGQINIIPMDEDNSISIKMPKIDDEEVAPEEPLKDEDLDSISIIGENHEFEVCHELLEKFIFKIYTNVSYIPKTQAKVIEQLKVFKAEIGKEIKDDQMRLMQLNNEAIKFFLEFIETYQQSYYAKKPIDFNKENYIKFLNELKDNLKEVNNYVFDYGPNFKKITSKIKEIISTTDSYIKNIKQAESLAVHSKTKNQTLNNPATRKKKVAKQESTKKAPVKKVPAPAPVKKAPEKKALTKNDKNASLKEESKKDNKKEEMKKSKAKAKNNKQNKVKVKAPKYTGKKKKNSVEDNLNSKKKTSTQPAEDSSSELMHTKKEESITKTPVFVEITNSKEVTEDNPTYDEMPPLEESPVLGEMTEEVFVSANVTNTEAVAQNKLPNSEILPKEEIEDNVLAALEIKSKGKETARMKKEKEKEKVIDECRESKTAIIGNKYASASGFSLFSIKAKARIEKLHKVYAEALEEKLLQLTKNFSSEEQPYSEMLIEALKNNNMDLVKDALYYLIDLHLGLNEISIKMFKSKIKILNENSDLKKACFFNGPNFLSEENCKYYLLDDSIEIRAKHMREIKIKDLMAIDIQTKNYVPNDFETYVASNLVGQFKPNATEPQTTINIEKTLNYYHLLKLIDQFNLLSVNPRIKTEDVPLRLRSL